MARWMCLRCFARSSWLSVSRCFIAANASSRACDDVEQPSRGSTVKDEVSGSGSAATRRSKVGWPQDTKPSGGFFLTTLRRALAVVAGLGQGLLVLDDVLGRLDDDPARGVEARAAGAAGDLVELTDAAAAGSSCRRTSTSAVKTTVRIGTLMPTPRVSVPQMTLSSPACASFSTSRRYLGSIPAWCTPMPCRTRRESVLPKPAAKRKPADQLRDPVLLLPGAHVRAHQRLRLLERGGLGEVHHVDGRLVGGRGAPRASRAAAGRGRRRSSGTGRSAFVITAVGRPVRRVRSFSKRVTSPSVADIRTNCALGSSSSGTCQAQPRSGSA